MKISAFLPITNAESRGDTYIQAIQSHLYWADELVVVDGGSTDGSIERIESLKNPKIKIVTRLWPQDNWSWTEFCKAWNFGLDSCDGDWVAAGESDHIFHQDEAVRLRSEVERETRRGKAVMRVQKLQSGDITNWSSKSQMYYFIYKMKFPEIRYGFSPEIQTDLCHPIWQDGKRMYEDIPVGKAVIEGTEFETLIGGTGISLYNYLWTFKTTDQVIKERMKANAAWNRFSGFTKIYGKIKEEGMNVLPEVFGQIKSVRQRANRKIEVANQPELMHKILLNNLKPEMIGSPSYKLIETL